MNSDSDAKKSPGEDPEQERVVIRDNRKIDPVTGEARKASPAADPDPVPGPGAISSEAEVPKAEALLLEERTRDLQRVSAEYANYRKRAERDRLAAGEVAVGRALGELLPVLDDLDRARAHGDLTGPLKAVADKLEGVFAKFGVESFGEVGDPFDPAIHEAVTHDESETVTVPTCTAVLRQGYRHRDRLLRPAMVGVTDPAVFVQVQEDGTPIAEPTDAQPDPTAENGHGGTSESTDEDALPAQPESSTSE